MSRKTTALIIVLVVLTAGLVALALRNSPPAAPSAPTVPVMTVAPTPPAHTTLSFSPQALSVAPYSTGSVAVMMDTKDNPVNVVQLELSYDPTQLTNVKVTPGTLFGPNSAPLLNSTDPKTGRITYMIGVAPGQTPYTGVGTLATVSFTTTAVSSQPVSLTLMKSSLVAARGVGPSVLKNTADVSALITVAGKATTISSVPATPAGSAATPAK